MIHDENKIIESEIIIKENSRQKISALVIKSISRLSPGAQLDIEVGDFLLSVNNKPAANIDLRDELLKKQSLEYLFFREKKDDFYLVKTKSVHLALDMEATSEAIVNFASPFRYHNWSQLKILWEREDWASLLRASDKKKFLLVLLNLLMRLFNSSFCTPAELFKGVALFELGQVDKGIKLINRFIEHGLSNHESFTHAIAYFYLSKWYKSINKIEQHERYLDYASQSNAGEFELISREYENYFNQEEAPKNKWEGKSFPRFDDLKYLQEAGKVDLPSIIENIPEKKYLPICVMPGYRANGPYDNTMHSYRSMYSWVQAWMLPIHVIYGEGNEADIPAWWKDNELKAIEEKIPLVQLLDSNNQVFQELNIYFSPHFYIISSKGMVVYEGSLEEPSNYIDVLDKIQ